jgi:hypothetical protein
MAQPADDSQLDAEAAAWAAGEADAKWARAVGDLDDVELPARSVVRSLFLLNRGSTQVV